MNYSGLILTFDEEFTSGEVPPTQFATAYGWSGGTTRTLSGNHEAEYYPPPTSGINPFSSTGKSLIITAAPSTDLSITKTLPYSSGMLSTWSTFGQAFGYWELRCRIGSGSGFWPAFWLLPSAIVWPWEIDVFEVFGGKNSAGEGGAFQVHTGLMGGTAAKHSGIATGWHTLPADPLDGNFHTYGLDWQESGLTWYMDGAPFATAPLPEQFITPGYLIVDLAVGSAAAWPGAPGSGAKCQVELDHLRVFSRFYDAPAVAWPGASAADGVDTTPVGAIAAGGPIKSGSGTITATSATHNTPTYASLPPAQFNLLVDGKIVAGPIAAGVNADTGAWETTSVQAQIFGAHTIGVQFIDPFYAPPYNRVLRIGLLSLKDPANNFALLLTASSLAPNQPRGVVANSDGTVSINSSATATFKLSPSLALSAAI